MKLHDPRNALAFRPTVLGLAVLATLGPAAAWASCTTVGSFTDQHCGADYIQYYTRTGTTSVAVGDENSTSVELAPNPTTDSLNPKYSEGPYDQTLYLQGTMQLTNPSYSGVISQTLKANRNISVYAESGVTIDSTDGFGGIWVRNDTSGHIYVESAATVTSRNGVLTHNPDGINAVTNDGNSTLINSGTVTAEAYRGLYAENGDSDHTNNFTAQATNTASGQVTAKMAGIRVINYSGLARLVNQGTVTSNTRQGLVAWAEIGRVEVDNSGSATSKDDSALHVMTGEGDIEAINSGFLRSEDDPLIPAVRDGYNGMRVLVDVQGSIQVTNTATGQIEAPFDDGIHAGTPDGAVTVTNAGQVTAKRGIKVSGASSGSVSNSGTVTADLAAMSTESGVVLTKVSNQAGGTLSGSIAMQGTGALENAGLIALPANTVSSVNGAYTQGIGASAGSLRIGVNGSGQFAKLAATGAVTLPAGAQIEVRTGDAAGCSGFTAGSTLASVLSGSSLGLGSISVTDDCTGLDFEAVQNGNALDLVVVVPQDAVCGTAASTPSAFKPASNLCAVGHAGEVVDGSPWAWTCDGVGNGQNVSCTGPVGVTGNGSGAARANVIGGSGDWVVDTVASAGFIPVSGHAKSPAYLPEGYFFPHGLFDLTLISGAQGSSAVVQITYPAVLPPGTVWMKFGPTADNATPHWYPYPGASISGDTVTLTLTDGGAGDHDRTANSVIVDPGGPAYLPSGTLQVPTLSQWATLALAGVLGLFGLGGLSRRGGRSAR